MTLARSLWLLRRLATVLVADDGGRHWRCVGGRVIVGPGSAAQEGDRATRRRMRGEDEESVGCVRGVRKREGEGRSLEICRSLWLDGTSMEVQVQVRVQLHVAWTSYTPRCFCRLLSRQGTGFQRPGEAIRPKRWQ